MDVVAKWKSERKGFLINMTVFGCVFYLLLPISIGLFPEFMSSPRIGWVSWAWLYGFAQIVMTWVLGWLYWLKAKELDGLLEEVKRDMEATE